MIGSETPGKEISWQEFSGKLLESGQVDRILISNKTTARYGVAYAIRLPWNISLEKRII